MVIFVHCDSCGPLCAQDYLGLGLGTHLCDYKRSLSFRVDAMMDYNPFDRCETTQLPRLTNK